MIDNTGFFVPQAVAAIFAQNLIHIFHWPGQPHIARVKIREECLESRRRVALWVSAHEDGDHARSARFINGFKPLERLTDHKRVGWTDVRAIGIAGIDDAISAGKVLFGRFLAILIDERETSTKARSGQGGWRDVLRLAPQQQQGQNHKSKFVHGSASIALLSRHNQALVFNRDFAMIRNALAWLALPAVVMVAAPAAAQFSDGYNFLKAVKDRDLQKANEIISKPGSTVVNTQDSGSEEGAIHIVTRAKDTRWVGFLLAKGARADLADKRGTTPLIIASQIGYLEGASLLLRARANVNLSNRGGETPLILAVQNRNAAMVSLLLNAGANPDKADRMSGLSAREYAKRDVRAQNILKLIEAPRATPKPVAGPK